MAYLLSAVGWGVAAKCIIIAIAAVALAGVIAMLAAECVGKRKRQQLKQAEENGVQPVEEQQVENAVERVEEAEPAEEQAEEIAAAEAVEETAEEPAEEIVPDPEPVKEPEPEVEAETVTEAKEEVVLEEDAVILDDEEEEDVGTVVIGETRLRVRYDRSFTAKLIQSDDALKGRYNELKNELLRYSLKTRMSWGNESFYLGRRTYAKFAVYGKTLSLYLALSPDEFADTKYKYENVGGVAKYAKTPMRLKLRSIRSVRWAKELIAVLAGKFGFERKELDDTDFYCAYEDTASLVHKRLIKLYKVVEEFTVNANGSEKRGKSRVLHEDFLERDFDIMEAVTVEEAAEVISDEEAEELVEELVVNPVKPRQRVKKRTDIINIEALSKNYSAGDTVTLDGLKDKKLIAPSTTYYKVLASGILDKPLIVEADDFSLEAVKMILLTGGRVIKTRYED